MAFKFVTVLALVSVTTAAHLPAEPALVQDSYAAAVPAYYQQSFPIAVQSPTFVKTVDVGPTIVKSIEYDLPTEYDFLYDGDSPLIGAQKNQIDFRPGENVQRSFSVVDSDGFKRTVEYVNDGQDVVNAGHRRPLLQNVAAPVGKGADSVAAVAQFAPVNKVVSRLEAVAPGDRAVQYATVANVVSGSVPVEYAPSSISKLVSAGTQVEYNASPAGYAATPSYKLTAPSLAPSYYAEAAAAGADSIGAIGQYDSLAHHH